MFSFAEKGFFSPSYRCNSSFFFIKHILAHSKFKRSWTVRFLLSFVKSNSNTLFSAGWDQRAWRKKKLPHSPTQKGSRGPYECKMPYLLPSPQLFSYSGWSDLTGLMLLSLFSVLHQCSYVSCKAIILEWDRRGSGPKCILSDNTHLSSPQCPGI